MKKIKLITLIAVITVCCLSLAACAPFEGYDSDEAIIKATGFSTVNSLTTQTTSEYSLKCDKANGVKKLKTVTLPENPVFDITLTIESGRFKVVLVKDGSVYTICDANASEPVSVELPAGEYSLRIVAENAKINFTVKFNSYS